MAQLQTQNRFATEPQTRPGASRRFAAFGLRPVRRSPVWCHSGTPLILITNSFLLLLVRHVLLEAMHLLLVASCYYCADDIPVRDDLNPQL